MAVPSSGELSLTGIALEMIQNKYQSHVTLSPGQSGLGDIQIGPSPNYPQPTGNNGFYSPIYALQSEDAPSTIRGTPAGITRDQNPIGENPFMQGDAETSRAVADISLAAISGMTEGQSKVAAAQTLPAGAAPVTDAHEKTYNNPGVFVGASTIMYTIYRGGSDNSGNHVIGAYVYSAGTAPPVIGSNHFTYVNPAGQTSDGNPIQDAPHTVVHPAEIGINTANPLSNRPRGGSPIPTANLGTRMSEFYSYDHDYVAPATTGVHFGPALFSGNGGTSLYTYNIELDDPTYAGGPVIGVGGDQYLVFAYKNGVSSPSPTTNFFHGDIQVTSFSVNGSIEPFGAPFPNTPTEKWFTTKTPGVNPATPNAATTPGATNAYNQHKSSGFGTAIPSPGSSGGRWNHKPSGAPGSSNTGVSDPTGYIYAETSSPAAYGTWFMARLNVNFTSNDVQLQVYRNGGNVGSLFVGIDIEEEACFVVGTLITMYDGTYKPIEEIQVGDIVFTQVGEEEVLRTLSPVHSDIVEYTFSDGTKTKNTSDHPYYVIDKGWCSNSPILTNQRYDIETEEFVCGDVCINENDEQIELVGIEKLDGDFQTYTFSTDSKTYYANKLLVHSEI